MILLKTNETNQTNKDIGLSSRRLETILTDHFSARGRERNIGGLLAVWKAKWYHHSEGHLAISYKIKKKNILFYCFFESVK